MCVAVHEVPFFIVSQHHAAFSPGLQCALILPLLLLQTSLLSARVCSHLALSCNSPTALEVTLFACASLQVIKYYADKVISLNADKAQSEVAKQIDAALK